MSDIQKLSAQFSTCTFVKNLRYSLRLCRATVPVIWRNPRLIQRLVAVQSYTEITCRATVAWKQTSYLAENYTSRCKGSNFFSGQSTYKNIGNWLSFLSKQHARGLLCFLSNLPFLKKKNIETSEEIVTLLEITLRYSSKEFLVTTVFYISDLDIKQQLDRAARKLGKFLPGVLHRYQIPAQSLNCWKICGDYMNYLLLVCVQASSLMSRTSGILQGLGNSRRQIQQDGSRATFPGRTPAAPFKHCNSLCSAAWVSLQSSGFQHMVAIKGHKQLALIVWERNKQ